MKSLEATWKSSASNLNSSSFTDIELSSWQNEFSNSELQPQESSTITVENFNDFVKNPSPYPFKANNPYLDHSYPFDEDSKKGETWQILCETHAADEREQLAIKAFEKAVGCGGADRQASWLSLATFWVNKWLDVRAQTILEQWLRDAYPELISADSLQRVNDCQNPWSRLNSLVELQTRGWSRAGPGTGFRCGCTGWLRGIILQ
ncbi:hypothetical protein PPACK8108_LOCUS370 [Phakopsora pachyrhizi]|uniref:Uncharacterized protein n=1 Tax=Phakopsora pachyrhizi TaxID=170000 RepID=A0AAV0AF60_PHAPC|nr:hypothetical protein PPACK8108_LOCUS370 [Phakopsora pachyrhizi]